MMLELIERIEALEGPDREVDALIWFECIGKADGWEYDGHQRKPYTASLDAAMTLVPEGWSGLFGFQGTHDYIEERGHAHIQTIVGEKEACAEAATPALALCAAALRARSSENG